MSANFLIKIAKEKEERGIILFDLCTTPARELAGALNLCYDDWTELDSTTIEEIHTYYFDEAERLKDCITKYEKKNKDYMNILPKCESVPTFHAIENEIDANECYINDWKEEVEVNTFHAHDIAVVKSIFEDSKEDGYKLYYYFA